MKIDLCFVYLHHVWGKRWRLTPERVLSFLSVQFSWQGRFRIFTFFYPERLLFPRFSFFCVQFSVEVVQFVVDHSFTVLFHKLDISHNRVSIHSFNRISVSRVVFTMQRFCLLFQSVFQHEVFIISS